MGNPPFFHKLYIIGYFHSLKQPIQLAISTTGHCLLYKFFTSFVPSFIYFKFHLLAEQWQSWHEKLPKSAKKSSLAFENQKNSHNLLILWSSSFGDPFVMKVFLILFKFKLGYLWKSIELLTNLQIKLCRKCITTDAK